MNLRLIRTRFEPEGIFGELQKEDGSHVAFTLEHSYDNAAKVPEGTYICVRGQHQLHSMKQPFTTFEITRVPGHSNILFHCGNTNKDSEGCILLGCDVDGTSVIQSRESFARFLALQEGVDSFNLYINNSV